MSLEYPVEIRRVAEEDGGGYNASIPSLGRYTFTGDGKTVQEAYQDLEEVKREVFADLLEEGIPIPEPVPEEEDHYSGKLLLRMPKRLHAELSEQAKKNGISLNQHLIYLLTKRSTERHLREIVQTEVAIWTGFHDESATISTKLLGVFPQVIEERDEWQRNSEYITLLSATTSGARIMGKSS